jgi:hypothetical protein
MSCVFSVGLVINWGMQALWVANFHKSVVTNKPRGRPGTYTLNNNVWTNKQLPCGWGTPQIIFNQHSRNLFIPDYSTFIPLYSIFFKMVLETWKKTFCH